MQDWSLHGKQTGGFFQCNRFVAAGEGRVTGATRADPSDMGSARAEAVRSKQRERQVERFLHYFTRFQAHGDSLRMERRMHKDTVARIILGLSQSARGNLRWLQGDSVRNPLEEDLVDKSAASDELNAWVDGVLAEQQTTSPGLSTVVSTRLIRAILPVTFGEKNAAGPPSASVPGGRQETSLGSKVPQSFSKLPCVDFLNKGFLELQRCRLVGEILMRIYFLNF